MQFLSLNYFLNGPKNDGTYESKSMGMTQILAKVFEYSHLFHEASFGFFNKWCSDRKLSFLNSKVERKGTINKKVSVLSLYALKEESIGRTYLMQIFNR